MNIVLIMLVLFLYIKNQSENQITLFHDNSMKFVSLDKNQSLDLKTGFCVQIIHYLVFYKCLLMFWLFGFGIRLANEFNKGVQFFSQNISGQKIMLILKQFTFMIPFLWIFTPLNPKKQIYWKIRNDIILIGCESQNVDQGRSYNNMNINIAECSFSRSSILSGDGGVIFVGGGSYSMNVNYSMFYNCVCSNEGGVIRFSSSNSYLRMICANRCNCGHDYVGHFAYITATSVNHAEYLSYTNCPFTQSGYYSFYLVLGNQRVDNTNSSMNKAIEGSGIATTSPSSFTSTQCTFSNNLVSSFICINIGSDSGIMSIFYANIVHNNSPSYGVVNTEGTGTRKMKYCIFNNNQNYLFCVRDGSLEVSNSFIDHSSFLFSKSLAVLTESNNSFSFINTYQMKYFDSHFCYANIPLYQLKLLKKPLRDHLKKQSVEP